MTRAPATGVVGVDTGVVDVAGVVDVTGVVVAGGVVVTGVVDVVLDGLRLRAAAATLLSLTVASLAESGDALAAVAVVLVTAAVSALSPPPQALNTALDAKQINNALLSFIIIYVCGKD